jgi:hypothetical protein
LFDFQYVTEFINLETRVTNQNCIPEEIKIWLSSSIACYHLVQNFFVLPSLIWNLKNDI